MPGIDAQLGYKTETTNGTAETVDTFLPFVSEAVTQEITRLNSAGLRAGRRTVHTWRSGAKTVGGSVSMELPNEDFATVLTHMFGAVTTDTTGSTPTHTHTATPGELDGKTFTLQVGRPDSGGTVRPFTYAGCKIGSWEISSGVDEIAQMSLEISAWTESTSEALASASYDADWLPFTFVDGSLTIGGTTNNVVTSVSLTGNNTLMTDRHRFGSATVKEQLENGMREYGGTVEVDFADLTAYNRFVNGTEAALVLTFDNGTESLVVTANARFDGSTPETGGPELLSQSLPFVCVSTTSDAAAITAVLTNDETTAA